MRDIKWSGSVSDGSSAMPAPDPGSWASGLGREEGCFGLRGVACACRLVETVGSNRCRRRLSEYFFSDSGEERERKILPAFLRGLGGVKIC